MEREKMNGEDRIGILDELAETVCDEICHRIDGVKPEDIEKVCDSCPFQKKYVELYRIVRELDEAYLDICRDNDNIKRRLRLYDLYSDMS